MGTLIMVGQLILSLSILIVLHEGGHFFPAKWFGTRVEKFYLFFDPGFSLFKYQKGETEYGIGWLPFGGYVKISGMIDESFDTEQLAQEPQPWEFRSKPAWQRLIIMIGGVTVNFFLGMLIFAGMLYVWGIEFLPPEKAAYGIYTDDLGKSIGLQDGDKILKIGDKKLERLNPGFFRKEIIVNDISNITVEREGREQKIELPADVASRISKKENRDSFLFDIRVPFEVIEPTKGQPAIKAGMKPGDKIIAINNKETPFYHEIAKELSQQKGKEVSLLVLRNQRDTVPIKMTTTDNGKIGVSLKTQYDHFGSEKQTFGFVESIPAGFKYGWNALADQANAIGQMISNKISAKDNLGSVFTIAKAYGSEWNWRNFWNLTATLSLLLAFLNLLPIPALDGGHVMFLLYEVISGRKPNDKVVEYATIVGFLILICLMVFVLGLDIWNNFIR